MLVSVLEAHLQGHQRGTARGLSCSADAQRKRDPTPSVTSFFRLLSSLQVYSQGSPCPLHGDAVMSSWLMHILFSPNDGAVQVPRARCATCSFAGSGIAERGTKQRRVTYFCAEGDTKCNLFAPYMPAETGFVSCKAACEIQTNVHEEFKNTSTFDVHALQRDLSSAHDVRASCAKVNLLFCSQQRKKVFFRKMVLLQPKINMKPCQSESLHL